MKIAFYNDHHYWGGVANNGGSRTILLSAKTLNEMGHEAVVVTHHDRFTWFKHPKPVRKVPKGADVVVAVSISDVEDILYHHVPGKRFAYWARPYETWQMPEDDIFHALEKFVKIGGVVLVNSEWQQKELAENAIGSTVIYQGYDIPPGGIGPGGPWEKSYYIGCQYSTKARKKWRDFIRLRAMLGDGEYRYVAFGDEPYEDAWLTKYVRRPSREELADFYRGCHFFFCPNKLEGLYNPAIEAALCGCLLVVNANCPKNGMADFCNDNTAAMYSDEIELAIAIQNPEIDTVRACQKIRACQDGIVSKIGTRERNMARMVEVLSA